MPRIPTYTAELGLPAGGTSPEMNGAAAAAPGRALERLGNTLEGAGQQAESTLLRFQAAKRERQDQDAAFWTAESAEKLSSATIEFLNNPENNTKETFGSDYKTFAESQVEELAKNAPNPIAARQFKIRATEISNRGWSHSLEVGEKTRAQNQMLAIKAGASDIVSMLRDDGGSPLSTSMADMLIENRLGTIDKMILSPAAKSRFRNAYIRDVVEGAIDINADYARKVVTDSPDLDENERSNYLHQIDVSLGQLNQAAVVNFRNEIESELTNGAKNLEYIKPRDYSQFEAVFGKKAEGHYASYLNDVKLNNEAAAEADETKQLAPFYQEQRVNMLRAANRNEVADRIAQLSAQARKDVQSGNTADLVMRSHDDVAHLFSLASNAQGPAKKSLLKQAYDKVLYYQGPPPLMLNMEEQKKFLGLPTAMQHVMSVEAASDRAAEIKALPPAQATESVKNLYTEFGDERLGAIAYNDMVTLPPEGKRLDAGLQMVGPMPSPELAAKVLGVIRSKEVKPMPDAVAREFRDFLYKEDDWNQFKAAVNADNNQRGGVADAWEANVIKYAHALNSNLSTKDAVKQAVRDTISGSFGKTKINSSTLLVMRDRGVGKPLRTDEEIADVGRRMAVSLRDFPIEHLNMKDPYDRDIFTGSKNILDPEAKKKFIHKEITSNAFFVTEAHGQSATVYLMDKDKGTATQLLDKRNQPFEIFFDDLPTYTEPRYQIFSTAPVGGVTPGRVEPFPIGLQKSYTFGKSNWPAPGPQYKRQAQ